MILLCKTSEEVFRSPLSPLVWSHSVHYLTGSVKLCPHSFQAPKNDMSDQQLNFFDINLLNPSVPKKHHGLGSTPETLALLAFENVQMNSQSLSFGDSSYFNVLLLRFQTKNAHLCPMSKLCYFDAQPGLFFGGRVLFIRSYLAVEGLRCQNFGKPPFFGNANR